MSRPAPVRIGNDALLLAQVMEAVLDVERLWGVQLQLEPVAVAGPKHGLMPRNSVSFASKLL